MNFALMRKYWLLGVLGFAVSACQKSDEEEGQRAKREIKIPSIDRKVVVGGAINGWSPYTRRDWHIRNGDVNLVLHGIARKEFENLTAFIKEFDRKYPGGNSYRSEFYDKFTNYDDYNRSNAGRYHDQYLNNLKEWAAENPKRGEPAIALAGFQIYLAWYARGAGYAHTVTDKGWKKFGEHVQQAREILENAPKAAKKDPHYYRMWITVHLAQGGSLQEVQQVFEAGQNVDPTYVDLYYGMTYFLQPKWHGENLDDWHTWLVSALKHPKLSDEERLLIYGDIVRHNLRGECDDLDAASVKVYQIYGIDKDRFMRGLAANSKRYSASSDWPSAYLYHAVRAGSEPSMKEALQLMDKKFSAGVFGGEKEFFITLGVIAENFPELAPLVNY